MSQLAVGLWVVSVAGVLWHARHLPLSGLRRTAVVACRLLAVTALCAAWYGFSHRRVIESPQRVLYVADASSSMDERQQDWVARRIASLESVRPRAIERALVTFAQEASLVVPWGRDPLDDPSALQAAMGSAMVTASETNLEQALFETLKQLPDRQGGRVVLLSDGWETQGQVSQVVGQLRRLGLSVFPVAVPVFEAPAPLWDALSAPSVVQRSAPIGLQLVLYHAAQEPQSADITVSLSGIPIKRQWARLRNGWQVVSVSVPAIQQGTMAIDVGLHVPASHYEERRRIYTEVEGPPHLLVVDDQPTTLPVVASALKRREMEISLARPRDLPTDPAGLLDYDAVLMVGVPKSALAAEQVDALRSYIERFDGGLVFVGLGGELAHEVSTPAPLDALLPVEFEAKGLQESQRRVCILMLVDRSASMIGPRLSATKRAAVEMVNQLADEDLVGVLAFDTKPYIVVEVQPAAQVRSVLVEKLVRLRSSGGTDVLPALRAAKQRLDQTGATLKHIILLSDGNTPFNRHTYHALADSFRADQVSVSTIGIGSVFVNTDYLEWLAAATDGRFYALRDLNDLPKLIAQDTQRELGKLPFAEGYFRPERSASSDWFSDIVDWPPLSGFLTTTAKPSARVDLLVRADEETSPLLARWSLGRGRVVTFASDADARWAADWVRWPGFEGWWAQVVRWALRSRMSEEMLVWVDDHESPPQLTLEGMLQDPQIELISAEGSARSTVSLVQTGAWRWQAALEGVPDGWYEVGVNARLPLDSAPPAHEGDDVAHADDASSLIFAKRWVQIGTPPAQQERQGQLAHELLLRQLAETTGGAFDAADRAFLPPTALVEAQRPLWPWLLACVVLLLLIDVALRGPSML